MEIQSMVKDLLATFIERIDNLSYMDEFTKQHAIAKARNLKYEKIGYPDYMMNDTHMDHRYQHLQVNCSDCYFENVLQVVRRDRIWRQEEFKKPVDKTKWGMNPHQVNAYYSHSRNEIVFLAGLLQPPFYAPHYTRSMKFGSIGMIIGHEITHGFDVTGSKYDKDGILANWWSNRSREAFDKSTRCISKYFSSYEVSGFNVNGNLTLSEDTSDIGGLRMAFS
ncbi:endothelin-converting enzyme homolog, partial [Lingula anatina]|uniref:Endothelin-converting enzyme homolog n=1 Tax=Lingula anatina TaxID=7574 RepID=A0A1S3K111_LINAN